MSDNNNEELARVMSELQVAQAQLAQTKEMIHKTGTTVALHADVTRLLRTPEYQEIVGPGGIYSGRTINQVVVDLMGRERDMSKVLYGGGIGPMLVRLGFRLALGGYRFEKLMMMMLVSTGGR